MRYDIDDISNRLKTLENAIIRDDNTVTIIFINRTGKIAHTLKFELKKPKRIYR